MYTKLIKQDPFKPMTNLDVIKAYQELDEISNTNDQGECWKIFLTKNFPMIQNHENGSITIEKFFDKIANYYKTKNQSDITKTVSCLKTTNVRIRFFGVRFHIYPKVYDDFEVMVNRTLYPKNFFISLWELMNFTMDPLENYPNYYDSNIKVRNFERSKFAFKLAEMSEMTESYGMYLTFMEKFKNGPSPFKTMMIGSTVGVLIDEAKRVLGPEIARGDATRSYANDLATTPTTQYRMSPTELKKFFRYVGFEIMSVSRKKTTNDHLVLAVTRELIRNTLDGIFPHNTDFSSVLHVGSTSTDVKRWYSHSGHDFFMCLYEDKDISRTIEDMIKLLGAKLVSMNLPALTTTKNNNTKICVKNLEELINLFELDKKKRIFIEPPQRSYSTLIFEDSLYNMTNQEMSEHFHRTGATTAYAIMFFPDKFFQ